MEIVARPDALALLRARGDVWLRARATRCCGGRQYTLEASLSPPPGETTLANATDGFRVHVTPGLVLPEVLDLELDRKGRIRAYWNGQSWIG